MNMLGDEFFWIKGIEEQKTVELSCMNVEKAVALFRAFVGLPCFEEVKDKRGPIAVFARAASRCAVIKEMRKRPTVVILEVFDISQIPQVVNWAKSFAVDQGFVLRA